jgi:hypothetical protein|tara:strand:- start:234 stop:437 length:204 start_codon:yes stop_codon:yes gene_type:complete
MKIRKGRKKYAVFVNSITMVCTLTKANSWYDVKFGNHIGSFECNFREAVHNLEVAKDKGYYITKRLR